MSRKVVPHEDGDTDDDDAAATYVSPTMKVFFTRLETILLQ